MQFKGKSGEFSTLEQITSKNCHVLKETHQGSLTILRPKKMNKNG